MPWTLILLRNRKNDRCAASNHSWVRHTAMRECQAAATAHTTHRVLTNNVVDSAAVAKSHSEVEQTLNHSGILARITARTLPQS